ncbi:hypothetical protein EDI_275430 [Entamoeba dispar SAW760]|uniref:TLDc domain-containing protein n=1 Tax=Entamoeba dispar (strain ATCC PRA-260 / SAW760) TaxID=370354 RepID=B0EKI0_ENTDS|nr:uncharacterized protein EDI_275430 [Entamoeba dispar SAW760]EDR24970.1 hypothetical protein EDI_275430 [Entamoeba dispar SAW760]|eukprot:EDR24970.1 hypothetical protein EDI_275430 [Entamoeba dispar SAW760]
MTTNIQTRIDQVIHCNNQLQSFLNMVKFYELSKRINYKEKYQNEIDLIAIKQLSNTIEVLQQGEDSVDQIESEKKKIIESIEKTLKSVELIYQECIKNREYIMNTKIEMINALKEREESQHNYIIAEMEKKLNEEKFKYESIKKQNEIKIEKTKKKIEENKKKNRDNTISLYEHPTLIFKENNKLKKIEENILRQPFDISIDEDNTIPLSTDSMSHGDIKKLIQEKISSWTSFSFKQVIFNSDQNEWIKGSCVFNEKVLNHNNLAFIITDTNKNKFGGFIYQSVSMEESYISDPQAFLFTIQINNKIEFNKFDITNQQYAFYLTGPKTKRLFTFGFGGYDLTVMKKGEEGSKCHQRTYQYNGHSLCGSDHFTPQHIEVWQFS